MILNRNTISITILLAGLLLLAVFACYLYFFKFLLSREENKEAQIANQQNNEKEIIPKKNKCLEKNLRTVYENDKLNDVGEIKIIVKDSQNDKIISDFAIPDVSKKNYHPIELHKCGIYVLKSFNFDYKSFKALPGFSRELWYYDYDGNGKQLLVLSEESETGVSDAGGVVGKLYLFNYSYDFRIDLFERYVVLLKGYFGSPDYALVIKDLKTLENVFILPMPEIEKQNPEIIGNIELDNWTSNGRYFWAATHYGAVSLGFIHIDGADWSYKLFKAPEDVLGGDALNLENGYITVHPGNVWFGVEEIEQEEKAKRRKEGVGTELYIYNLFTGERRFIYKTDEPLWFSKPKWLSEIELEYELPSGEKKIYKINK